MDKLVVPILNNVRSKTEVKVFLEHRIDVFAYLDERKKGGSKNSVRVSINEILNNTTAELSWEAANHYSQWLKSLGKEEIDNGQVSTEKTTKTTSEKQEECGSEEISTIPSERGEETAEERNGN